MNAPTINNTQTSILSFRQLFFLLLCSIVLIITTGTGYAQGHFHTEASSPAQLKSTHTEHYPDGFYLGIGGQYSLIHHQSGSTVRLNYHFHENWSIGPEFSYFLSDNISIIDFDLIGHYNFHLPFMSVYPLAGVNYVQEHERDEHTIRGLGWVYGIGCNKHFKSITLYIETMTIMNQVKDQYIGFGLLYHEWEG